tara:strand:- start:1448 stop:2326 length:879 start_codon:yes stop_codon:yes gene_type:complete
VKILVTGGLGFVGSNLIAALVNKGNTVFCLDNLFTGKNTNRIAKCIYRIGETKDICKLFKNDSIDIVYHLGEYSRVEQSYEDVDLVFQYNWAPIYEVIKFARQKKAKLVYSGSSTKYGDHGHTKYSSPYAFTKTINSELIKNACEWFDIDYAITYFYNVYGKGEIEKGKYATVIAKFLHLKKNNAEYLPVTSPGHQKRNFTHIDDIVSGLVLVGMSGSGDGYGIGSNISYSIIELAEMLEMPYKLTKPVKGNRMFAPVLTDSVKLLGWKENCNLADYIRTTYTDYKNNKSEL